MSTIHVPRIGRDPMKPKQLCPHCFRVLNMEKAVDRGDFWAIECDFCHEIVMKAKASSRRERERD